MHVNDFFSQQYKPIINSSVKYIPVLNFLTDKRINHITIQSNAIMSFIRNKATGPDGISGQMLLLCGKSVLLPLKMLFQNVLVTSKYTDMWKLANVTPIFKNGGRQSIKRYRPISLLPICGKIFENIFQ